MTRFIHWRAAQGKARQAALLPILLTTLLATLLAPISSQAGPMGFKDSSMAMGDFSPNWQEA